MPLYQTKTIANILEPVAQQVSKLIILHEEGEDGNSMPDLEAPVVAVSKAVNNLVRLVSIISSNIILYVKKISRVGRDTINNSQDMKMKSEMPKSLAVIEKASESLAAASSTMKSDPYSKVTFSGNKSLNLQLFRNIFGKISKTYQFSQMFRLPEL